MAMRSLNLLILPALAFLNGCYSFSATCLPSHIHTVRIDDVQNLTTDPLLGIRLREGLLTLFRKNASGIRIVSDNEDADAEFQLTLTNYTNATETYTSSAEVETYKVTLTADVSFRDLVKNTVIYQGKALRAEGVYDISQNETEDQHGQERAIEKLQELIVNNALAKW
ncbi:MAG TPA: LPS assembly lipoprotein LptE [Fibrobacteraceae bacterium]|nr:LPS assembly lipoprotein LptE [Fibrobacteraceae bacterium]